MTCIVYVHGFNSSPQSAKARQLQAWAAAHRPDLAICVPALPMDPEKALALLESLRAVLPPGDGPDRLVQSPTAHREARLPRLTRG